MAVVKTWLKTDLSKPIPVVSLDGEMFTYDNNANQIGVKVYENGEPVTLVGDVLGYIIRSDGVTVYVEGTKSNNEAVILLPENAYSVIGVVTIIIRIKNGNDMLVIGACTGHVTRSRTEAIVDPEEIISIENLPISIESMTTYYQNSTSGSEIPTGEWVSTIPTTPQGYFLWQKNVIEWNNGQETIMYEHTRFGIDGLGTVSTVNNVSPDSNGNVALVSVSNNTLVIG